MAPIVFISYTHDSEEHKEQCMALKLRLLGHGIECIIDQDIESPPEGWPLWCERQIEKAHFVLVVCTETYNRRFNLDEEAGKGKGARYEGYIIRQMLFEDGALNPKFIPVIFTQDDQRFIPRILSGVTHYLITDPNRYRKLYRRLTDQPEILIPPRGDIQVLDPRTVPPLFGDEDPLSMPSKHNRRSRFIREGPVRFSFPELEEIIRALHETIISTDPTAESRFDRTITDLELKNKLNKLNSDYFQDMVEKDDPYSAAIERFLSHPANQDVTFAYHEVVDELRRKILLIRDKFGGFEEILQGLYDAVIEHSPDGMKGKRQVLNIVLSYMYLQCDIGQK
jgi:hypothetical protein